jgi:hypothetical protein
MNDTGDLPKFGPCCMCETEDGVRNMVMLDRRCAIPGHGWGCVVCDLPPDGAAAVLCDPCAARYRDEPAALTVACRGYPAIDGRVAIAQLPAGAFAHDEAKHARDQGGNQLLEERRPGIGDNLGPSLDDEIAATLAPFIGEQADLLAVAGEAVIIDAASATKCTELVALMRAFERRVDAIRDEMKAPYLAACRQIDASFGAVIRSVALARSGEDGRGGILGMLTRFAREQEAKAQAERDRLAAEKLQREAEAEAARRAAEEKRAAGSGGIAAELEAMQAEEAARRLGERAQAIRPDPIRAQTGSLGTVRTPQCEILDLRKAAAWMTGKNHPLEPQLRAGVEAILRRHLKMVGVAGVERGLSIPGVRTWVDRQARVR